MGIYIIAAILLIVVIALAVKPKKAAPPPAPTGGTQSAEEAEKEKLPITGAYQKRWLFTYHEKDAYFKLLELCQKYGLHLMAKVRLLDLLEPVKGNPKQKSYFWKVQAKHVDFVLCDKKLVARCVIELDDSSHDTPERKARDEFVDEALQSVGYAVIHQREIDPAAIEEQLQTIFRISDSVR